MDGLSRPSYPRRSMAVFWWAGLALAVPVSGQKLFEEVYAIPRTSAVAVAIGDYDNDGRVDLFASADGQTASDYSGKKAAPLAVASMDQQPVVLLHNESPRGFFEHAVATWVDPSPARRSGGATFVDHDNDGDLDLFVPTGYLFKGGVDRLLDNSRGHYADVTDLAGLSQALPTDAAIWFDYVRDGDLDLYVGRFAGHGNVALRNTLWRNDGNGTFAQATREAGLDHQFSEGGGSRGGMAAVDFDDDGWPDLYVGVHGDRNRLFLNDRLGGFSEITAGDLADLGQAHGVAIGDIDNDLDLITATPQHLYLNDGDGRFVDASQRSGLDRTGLSIAFLDYDLDGFVDVMSNRDRVDETLGGGLYRNAGNGNHWLRVELVGTRSNRYGIGARDFARSGDLTQMRELLSGSGYNQIEPVVHFGLGQRTRV